MRTRVIQAEEATVDVRFCLMFPREALSVPVMRRVLGDTLRRLGVDEDCIGDLLLAVTEACTNVLQHGGAQPSLRGGGQHRPQRLPGRGAGQRPRLRSRQAGRAPAKRRVSCRRGTRAVPPP